MDSGQVLTSTDRVCITTHVTSAEIIRRITAAGWHEVKSKGSHHQFKHPSRTGRVTVPHPVKDMPLGTLRSIERQSGVKLS